MNTKNNKRRRESVERIRNAFFTLLRKNDLQNIKVSELCKLAEINRSTFYANYVDIYDLADKTCLELKKEVDRLFYLSADSKNYESEFLKLLNHIYDHRELYLFYFKLGNERNIVQPDSFHDTQLLKNLFGKHVNYHIAFFKNGFNAIVKLWLENGCRESPREMCDILLQEYYLQHRLSINYQIQI